MTEFRNLDLDTTLGGTSPSDYKCSSQKAIKTYVDNNLIPVGSIIMYGASTAPTGYLICNGQAVSRTTYSDLFNVIGTTYGSGDGSTTFNVPNMNYVFASYGSGSNVCHFVIKY